MIDTSKNHIIYAHCVAMTKPFGPAGPSNPYRIRSHAEDRKGASMQSLLPEGPVSFSGYRLLREYFNLPQRFMFVEMTGLGPAVRRCAQSELDVIVLLDEINQVGIERYAITS